MKKALLWLLGVATSLQASSFQEYCSNGAATVKVARGHIENQTWVTERIKKDWSFVNHRVLLEEPLVLVTETKKLEEHKEKICDGKWGVHYWRDVFYKKIRLQHRDGRQFAAHTLGVSKDMLFVDASVICEEEGNSEVLCEDSQQKSP